MAGKKAKKKGGNTKKKQKWLIGVGVAAVVLGFGIVGAKINSMDKTNEVSATFGWEVGLLSTTDGGEVKGTTSLRTKKLHDIGGLVCDLTEDASISYRLFWYDENEEFISVSDELTADFSVETAELPEGAKYFRVMATPENDPEVSGSEVSGYAKELTISYDK